METPDITPVQKLVAGAIGVLTAGLAAAGAFGVGLSTAQSTSIIGLATALGSFLVLADAIIRHGRAGLASTQASIDYSAYVDALERLGKQPAASEEATTEDAQQA